MAKIRCRTRGGKLKAPKQKGRRKVCPKGTTRVRGKGKGKKK